MQFQDSFLRLALLPPLIARFNTVIERVSKKVIERGGKFLQNVPVDWCRLTLDLEPYCFAESARNIAHHPVKSLNSIGKRSHAAIQHLVVQAPGGANEAPIKQVEIHQPL